MSEAGSRKQEAGSSVGDEFDVALTRAMRRVEVPEGFAASVMERAAAPAARKVFVMRPRIGTLRAWPARSWFGGALAAMLVAGVFVADQVHARREREQAALATQQFETAMRVTDHALDQTRDQLRRAGIKLGD